VTPTELGIHFILFKPHGWKTIMTTYATRDVVRVMSTHASVLVDSVGPPSAEVCRAAASFP
jgi:hypothetical protein